MTAKIIQLNPEGLNPALGLRNIADQYEAGEFGRNTPVTLVIGREVFHLGTHGDTEAALQAVFDMNFGIHKMMNAAL